jgi:hypothetical protein
VLLAGAFANMYWGMQRRFQASCWGGSRVREEGRRQEGVMQERAWSRQ